MNDFFTSVANTKPFFKAMLFGEAGCGKTWTAGLIAVGLHKRIGSTKPVIIFDTEKAAKFLKKMFGDAEIELQVKESRTFADLMKAMEIIRRDKLTDILIIDSVTHVWEELIEGLKKANGRDYMQIQDWGLLKSKWNENFIRPFQNDPYSIIVCGRAGYAYSSEVNESTGKRESFVSGVRMNSEKQTPYEGDITIFMERVEELLKNKMKISRQAKVIKDRSTAVDGKVFVNPTYENFAPAIEAMLAEPELRESNETDSTGLFRSEEDKQEWKHEREILLEKIQTELLRAYPSTGGADKKGKIEAVRKAFGPKIVWGEVERMTNDQLKTGLEKISEIVEQVLAKEYPGVKPEEAAK